MKQRLKNTAEIVASLVSLWVTIVAVAGTVWFFVDNEARDVLARLSGAERTAAQLEAVAKEMVTTRTELHSRIDGMEKRLDQIATHNRVFEIDTIRSLVWDDCPTEGQCRYTWRVRRTELGKLCQLTDANRFVIDRFGVTHPVEAASATNQANKEGLWTELSNAFILPDQIPTGVAEFYMEMTYYECLEGDAARKVRETTPKLTFQINDRN